MALAASFEHLSQITGNARAKVIADALDRATAKFLESNKSPGRKVGQLDNIGSHFYLTLYWAEALAQQTQDADLKKRFEALYKTLSSNETKILDELKAAQGKPVDLGGYYRPDAAKAAKALRPSVTLNAAIAAL